MERLADYCPKTAHRVVVAVSSLCVCRRYKYSRSDCVNRNKNRYVEKIFSLVTDRFETHFLQ